MSIVKQNGLKLVMKKGNVFCDSRELAKQFDKRHEYVLRSIKKEIEKFEETLNSDLCREYFKEDSYITNDGRSVKKYLLTFKGFQTIALQFSGKKAFSNRITFIEFFEKLLNNIEADKLQAITNSKDELWLQFREEGKEFRTKLTDAIKLCIVKYRSDKEKKFNDGKYYYHYTSLIYKKLNIDLPKAVNPRDVLDKRMLVRLEDLEDKVAELIVKHHDNGVHYKEAYNLIKDTLKD